MSKHHPAERAKQPWVLAIDVGSTATRGDIFDATGHPVTHRERLAHQFTTRIDGTVQIDPDQVTQEVSTVISNLLDRVDGPVAGVSMDTFASSLVGVDRHGKACTPCYTYADSRCAAQVDRLRAELDEAAAQQRTGCRLHTSYLAPRLRWLRDTEPGLFGAAQRWMSLGEYVHLKLLGGAAVGTSTAAWTGMLDRRTGRWDAELLAACGVSPDQLSAVRDPDQPMRTSAHAPAGQWKQLAGAEWFPVITDGFASNLGAGADDGATVALSAATSGAMRVLVRGIPDQIPAGLWCYRVDRERCLLGGAINDVGRVTAWLTQAISLAGRTLNDIASAAPDPAVPLMLPFLTGERSTGWASNASAIIAGITASTSGAQIARGALEGVALSYRRIADQLAQVTDGVSRIHASGRVLQDLPALGGLLADVLAAPLVPITTRRTTLRGTALLALQALDPSGERAGVSAAEECRPMAERAAYYRGRAEWYQALYQGAVAAPRSES